MAIGFNAAVEDGSYRILPSTLGVHIPRFIQRSQNNYQKRGPADMFYAVLAARHHEKHCGYCSIFMSSPPSSQQNAVLDIARDATNADSAVTGERGKDPGIVSAPF